MNSGTVHFRMATDGTRSGLTLEQINTHLFIYHGAGAWEKVMNSGTVHFGMAAHGMRSGLTARQINTYLSTYWPKPITESVATRTLTQPGSNGRITKAGFSLEVCGLDPNHDLSLELDITINGVSVFSVKPKIDQTAGNEKTTLVAGTGITVGVLNDLAYFEPGDIIKASLALVRTAPATEMQGCIVELQLEEGAPSESEWSNEIKITTLES